MSSRCMWNWWEITHLRFHHWNMSSYTMSMSTNSRLKIMLITLEIRKQLQRNAKLHEMRGEPGPHATPHATTFNLVGSCRQLRSPYWDANKNAEISDPVRIPAITFSDLSIIWRPKNHQGTGKYAGYLDIPRMREVISSSRCFRSENIQHAKWSCGKGYEGDWSQGYTSIQNIEMRQQRVWQARVIKLYCRPYQGISSLALKG